MNNKISFYNFLPGIAWFFIVLVLMCIPGEDMPGNSFLAMINFDKFAHACVFGLLVIFFIRPIAMTRWPAAAKRKYFIQITVFTILWGLATEFIQKYFVVGREFDLFDFVADSTGAGTACWFSLKYLLNRAA